MFWKGLWLTALLWLLTLGVGYILTVAWPGFAFA
jgi:hypothetical protein